MEEEPVGGREGGQLRGGDLADASQLPGTHSHQVEGHLGPHPGEHVGAEAAPTPGEVVDHDQASGQLTGGSQRGGDHPVLDDPGGRGPAVPHEPVEGGHVHDQGLGVVDRVAGVGGMALGRVVLEVDPGPRPLVGGEDLVAVDLPVAHRLGEDRVDLEAGHLLGRHLVEVGGAERAPPSVALRSPGLDRQVPVDGHVGQRGQVTPVDVPGQDAQPGHAGALPASAPPHAAADPPSAKRWEVGRGLGEQVAQGALLGPGEGGDAGRGHREQLQGLLPHLGPRSVRWTVLARRSTVSTCRPARPRSSRSSITAVTHEGSQCHSSTMALMGLPSPGTRHSRPPRPSPG